MQKKIYYKPIETIRTNVNHIEVLLDLLRDETNGDLKQIYQGVKESIINILKNLKIIKKKVDKFENKS